MSILRVANCPAVPWKNGLGRTRELAIQPPGAGMDDFLWRVSVAEVETAAPFSAFPGVDRVISAKSATDEPRRPGVVGLYLRIAMFCPYPPVSSLP